MPTYDYKCIKCENVQEEFHMMKESPLIKCNNCGSECKKIMSTVGFSIKGESGSYSQKIKNDMTSKNKKMGEKMKDRYASGEGVRSLGDLKKHV